jgi:hypothetical protein
VLEQRAEAEAHEAKELARNAKVEQEHAEEAEQLALQRMHALEASGMQVCRICLLYIQCVLSR